MQVLNFGSVAEVRTGGVAYLAHIAGFLFGVVFARMLVDRQRLAYSSVTF
jgi:membrane associated rhomboid family serine protease